MKVGGGNSPEPPPFSVCWCRPSQRLWPMGDDTVFIPGHGPESSFGRERRSNPFVGGT